MAIWLSIINIRIVDVISGNKTRNNVSQVFVQVGNRVLIGVDHARGEVLSGSNSKGVAHLGWIDLLG